MKGRLNVYVCENCKKWVFTYDRDDGATPFMIECRATPLCSGIMQSQFYPISIPPHVVPEYEWYKAKIKKHMDEATKDHIRNGGLMLRKLEPNRAIEIARQRLKECGIDLEAQP